MTLAGVCRRWFLTVAVSPGVPLARRNLLADRKRLRRATASIGFAVMLMMTELGFQNAFIESAVLPLRQLNGELMIVGSQEDRSTRRHPFPGGNSTRHVPCWAWNGCGRC